MHIYAQLTLANVEAGETPITYKIATKSVPEWLQITPMLGTLRSISPTLQHPSFFTTKISHFSTLMFLGTLRSGESIDITIHINHNIANEIKKNEYQNLHCLLIIQYFIYTNNTNANNNNNNTTSASQNTTAETENAIFSLSSKGNNDLLSNPAPVPPPLNIQQQPQQQSPQQQYTLQHQQQYTPPSSLYSSKEQPLLLSPSYKGALTPRSSVKYTTTHDNTTNTINSNTNTSAHTSSNNNSITKSPQKIIDKITVTDPPLCNIPTENVSETLLYSVDKLIIPILYGVCQVDGKSTG